MKFKYIIVSSILLTCSFTAFAYSTAPSSLDTYILTPSKEIIESATGKDYYLKVLEQESQGTRMNIESLQNYLDSVNKKIQEYKSTNGNTSSELFDFEKSCKIIKNNLWIGRTDKETNGEVTLLQKLLVLHKYLSPSDVTGYYGPRTSAAVYKYQKEVLKFDWVTANSGVGPKTRAEIGTGLLRVQDSRCWN
jgi:hypothetical protein